jgi:ComF family protein
MLQAMLPDKWRRGLSVGLDILYPPVCAFCRRVCPQVPHYPGICRSCLCRLPFRDRQSAGISWRELAGRRIPEQAIVYAAAEYQDTLRQALLRFKFGDAPDLAAALASLLVQQIRQQGLAARAVVAVPLHASRLRERGYNQAALLATQIARQLEIPDWSDFLRRIRATGRQSEQEDRAMRLLNLSGAFSLTPEFIQAIAAGSIGQDWQSRSIILVDDVLTTGATLSEAADPFWQSGWSVTGLVVASNHRLSNRTESIKCYCKLPPNENK